MNNEIDFNRIKSAIDYIHQHFKSQPDLDEVARYVNLSPFHFQRLFTEWAGVSPKKFLQYISLKHAKGMLRKPEANLFDTAFETGLSGTGRLHDLFVNIEGMSPGEYKNGGAALTIYYSYGSGIFGPLLLASTAKGICHLTFADDKEIALQALKKQFPNARFSEEKDQYHEQALQLFQQEQINPGTLKLHLKGTLFQLKVWEALLKIAPGQLTNYGRIADNIQRPRASRAVGSAVGDNPVAFIIPCHRVIQSSGILGEYHWGSSRKKAMIGWEAAQCSKQNENQKEL